jgi:hypothetical protein
MKSKEEPKLIFAMDQVADAVMQAFRLKLIEDYAGYLKVGTNGEEIIIAQIPNNSLLGAGYYEIYSVDDHTGWGLFHEFYEREDGRIEIESDDKNDPKGRNFRHVKIVSKEEAFDQISNNIFDLAIEQAEERLASILEKIEKEEEVEV